MLPSQVPGRLCLRARPHGATPLGVAPCLILINYTYDVCIMMCVTLCNRIASHMHGDPPMTSNRGRHARVLISDMAPGVRAMSAHLQVGAVCACERPGQGCSSSTAGRGERG